MNEEVLERILAVAMGERMEKPICCWGGTSKPYRIDAQLTEKGSILKIRVFEGPTSKEAETPLLEKAVLVDEDLTRVRKMAEVMLYNICPWGVCLKPPLTVPASKSSGQRTIIRTANAKGMAPKYGMYS